MWLIISIDLQWKTLNFNEKSGSFPKLFTSKNINIENYRSQLFFSMLGRVLPWKASLSCLSLTICTRSAILEKVRL